MSNQHDFNRDVGFKIATMQAWLKDELDSNSPNGKFKLNQYVIYIGNKFPEFKGQAFVVTSCNEVDDGLFEYSLAEFPYLVWEDELKAL